MLSQALTSLFRMIIGTLVALVFSLLLVVQSAKALELPAKYAADKKCDAVLLEFYWAECGACQRLDPKVKAFQKAHASDDVDVHQLEVYEFGNGILADKFGVKSVPSFFLFGGNGKLLHKAQPGQFNPETLMAEVNEYRKAQGCSLK